MLITALPESFFVAFCSLAHDAPQLANGWIGLPPGDLGRRIWEYAASSYLDFSRGVRVYPHALRLHKLHSGRVRSINRASASDDTLFIDSMSEAGAYMLHDLSGQLPPDEKGQPKASIHCLTVFLAYNGTLLDVKPNEDLSSRLVNMDGESRVRTKAWLRKHLVLCPREVPRRNADGTCCGGSCMLEGR